MKIRMKKMNCILLILVLIIAPVIHTNAATYKLTVSKYAQERTNWCWAACAKMLGNYYGRNFTQSNICTRVKGGVVNQTASLSEVTSAIRYTTNKLVVQGGVTSFSSFVTEMKGKRPRVIRMGWNAGGGHVYVVAGAQEASGALANALYLIDPISGVSSGYYGYTSLVNGRTLASGTGRFTHTWTTLP